MPKNYFHKLQKPPLRLKLLNEIIKYDKNIANGIINVIKENKISDLILGLHKQKSLKDSFLGNLTEGILAKCNITTLIYRPAQPFGTIKRHIIKVLKNAQKEIGFTFWLFKVLSIAKNSGAKLIFFAHIETLSIIEEILTKQSIKAQYNEFSDWDDFLILGREFSPDDNLIIILSRYDKPSYQKNMQKIPTYLNKYFNKMSFILIYPMQIGVDSSQINFTNQAYIEPNNAFSSISRIFN